MDNAVLGSKQVGAYIPAVSEFDVHEPPEVWERATANPGLLVSERRRSPWTAVAENWLPSRPTSTEPVERQLPSTWDAILAAFDRAAEILSWKDDWDDEGSVHYEMSTLERTKDFVLRNVARVQRISKIDVPVPRVLPGPDGGIDLHWRNQDRELLLTVPSDAAEPATFYGDDKGRQSIKGTLDTSANNEWLMAWLAA